MNLSREGLFVLTSFAPVHGEQLRLHIQEVDGLDRMTLEVEVVRRRSPPPDLAHLTLGGLGLQILEAPEDYQKLVYDDEEPAASSTRREKPSTPQECGRFRARVANFKMARTKTLTVEARDEAEAALRVYQQLGPDWGIVELQRL